MTEKYQVAADKDEYEAYLARAQQECGPIRDGAELVILGMGGHPVAWVIRPKQEG